MRMSLKKKIIASGVVPILLLGLLAIFIMTTMVKDALIQEVKESLRGTAYATLAAYDQNAGEYLQSTNGDVWKGGYNISRSESLVDSIKQKSGMDVTFFYGDRRIMTSALDGNGQRILGSPAGETIVQKVLQGGEEYFSEGVSLDGELNYGYFVPVHQNSGNKEPVGMVFTGANKAAKDQAVNRIVNIVVGSVMTVMALCIIFTFVLSGSISSSLHKSIRMVQTVAGGNLGMEPDRKLLERKDEIGELSGALRTLQKELRNILAQIGSNTGELLKSSDGLEKTAEEAAETMHGVETAVLHIAQSADEQARDSLKTSENVHKMGDRIEVTASEVDSLNENAADMRLSSEKAAETMKRLHGINEEVQASIEKITVQTNETNEAARQIRAATEMITEIAEETNLLALNASIEAARAGEHGRGFAVVASQIQKLAEQSNASSRTIEEIITVLMHNSDEAVEDMRYVQDIIGSQSRSLQETEAIVAEVSRGIGTSIHSIGQIGESTSQLRKAREEIIDAVKGLTEIAETNAANTEETSAVANELTNNFEMVEKSAQQLKVIAGRLEECVKYFRL